MGLSAHPASPSFSPQCLCTLITHIVQPNHASLPPHASLLVVMMMLKMMMARGRQGAIHLSQGAEGMALCSWASRLPHKRVMELPRYVIQGVTTSAYFSSQGLGPRDRRRHVCVL